LLFFPFLNKEFDIHSKKRVGSIVSMVTSQTVRSFLHTRASFFKRFCELV